MKLVEWTDENGYKHLSLLRNDDPDDMALYGIQKDPPDVSSFDWQVIKKELHNALVERRLVTWRDVQLNKDSITSAVLSILRRRLITLFKEREQQEVK